MSDLYLVSAAHSCQGSHLGKGSMANAAAAWTGALVKCVNRIRFRATNAVSHLGFSVILESQITDTDPGCTRCHT